MACLISAIGFDEKFVFRSVLRRGKSQIDHVLILKPPSPDDERTVTALHSLRSLLSEANIPLEVLEVDYRNFLTALTTMISWLRKSKHTSYILNLSSGLRVLNLEIFSSFLFLGLDAEVEVEAEKDFSVITFRVKDVIAQNLSPTDGKILLAIHQGENRVSDISRKLKIPIATAWRHVRDLQKLGYLNSNDEIELTIKGQIYVRGILSSS